jgi:hypothetical protein
VVGYAAAKSHGPAAPPREARPWLSVGQLPGGRTAGRRFTCLEPVAIARCSRIMLRPVGGRSVAGSLMLASLLICAGWASAAADWRSTTSSQPVPGGALRDSMLRLIVAGTPPFAIDVDARRVTTIHVPGKLDVNRPSSIIQLGAAAALIGGVACVACGQNQAVFLLRPRSDTASRFGEASRVVPAGRNAAWLLRSARAGVCSMQRVSLGGSEQPARASRCAGQLDGQTPPGVIINTSLLVDPRSGRVRLRASGLRAASGSYVLRSPASGKLLLQAIHGHLSRRLRWPSTYAFLQGAVPRPNAPQIALWFVSGPVDQHIDLWRLSVSTGRFTHVPGFPVAAELKRTSLTWTADGRLVILTRVQDRDALIVWRAGASQAASTFLDLPASRSPGEHAIAAWDR